MRRWTSMLGIVAIGAAVALVGCDRQDQQDGEKGEKAEAPSAEESAEQAEQEQAEEEETEYSREDYLQVSYELSCIDAELAEDELDLEGVEQDVLGKYGFDAETYEQAENEFGDDQEVTDEIDSKLEECTSEKAREFAGLSEQEDGEGEGGDDGQAESANEGGSQGGSQPKPATVGTISSTIEESAGFSRAELKLTVRDDFSANGTFKGRREGKGFQVSLDGEVSEDNSLSLSGTSGKNEVSVSGPLKDSGATAEISGTIWERKFSTTMQLD